MSESESEAGADASEAAERRAQRAVLGFFAAFLALLAAVYARSSSVARADVPALREVPPAGLGAPPLAVDAVVWGAPGGAEAWAEALRGELPEGADVRAREAPGGEPPTAAAEAAAAGDDVHARVDRALHAALGDGTPGRLAAVLLPGDGGWRVGQFRHAWAGAGGTDAARRFADQVAAGALARPPPPAAGRERASHAVRVALVLGGDEHPSAGAFEAAVRARLTPLLARAAPAFAASLRFQVVRGARDLFGGGLRGLAGRLGALHLDIGLDGADDAGDAPLHLVVYAEADDAEAKAEEEDGKNDGLATYLVPGWGAVARWRPGAPTGEVAGVVAAQLRSLVGLQPPSGAAALPAPAHGMTLWEADALARRYAAAHAASAVARLRALGELLESVPHMPVGRHIADAAAGAVAALGEARRHSVACRPDLAAPAAARARALARGALFDPGMVPLLYFPEEHTLAVVGPFLVPVLVHFASGVARSLRG